MRSTYKSFVVLHGGDTPTDMQTTHMDMVWGLVSVTHKLTLHIRCPEIVTRMLRHLVTSQQVTPGSDSARWN